jgi:hypothetical protein
VAHALLTAGNIDAYLDAGEATRPSAGGYFLDLLRTYRNFRSAVGRALQAKDPQVFDDAWMEANSNFRSLHDPLLSYLPRHLAQRLADVARWLDAALEENKWLKLLEAMNDPNGNVAQARETAQKEARQHLEQVRVLLRQVRQGASFNDAG